MSAPTARPHRWRLRRTLADRTLAALPSRAGRLSGATVPSRANVPSRASQSSAVNVPSSAGRAGRPVAGARPTGARGRWRRVRELALRPRAAVKALLYPLYERRLTRALAGAPVPRHVGVMCDGNRRWAREMGYVDPNDGHRAGAARIKELLGWCDQAGIAHVTLYLLATDNLRRPAAELDPLIQIIEDLATELAEDGNPWRLVIAGALDLLPAEHAAALKAAAERTAGRDGAAVVNLAVGYGGRREIADAVRSLLASHAEAGGTLAELAETLDVEDIDQHLYTRGQPDPDLVIRTSGEQRLSGFLLWQSANSEFYFHDANWPDFRHIDFLRALRSYSRRQRRYGV